MSTHIHPSATVDPSASLGEGVRVGPHAVIAAGAVLGPDCEVLAHAIVEAGVESGARNLFGSGCVIGGAPQDLSWTQAVHSRVLIGSDNVFREHVTIHRGATQHSVTSVGDRNYFMVGAHLGHNCEVGNEVVIANNCLLGGHVKIDDRAFLGGGCVFHQYVRVGRLVMTQGMSGFGKDLPPCVMAARVNRVVGLNAVGMRRAGYGPEERGEIRRAFDLLYRSGRNTAQALEEWERTAGDWGAPGREFFEFVAAKSKRGLCSGPRANEDRDEPVA